MSYDDMTRKDILEDLTHLEKSVREHINDFPFERVEWDNEQYLRMKGYPQAPINPAISAVIERWLSQLKIIVGEEQ